MECDSFDDTGRLVTKARTIHSIGHTHSGHADLSAGNGNVFVWADLGALQSHYVKAKRGQHPAWAIELKEAKRGRLTYRHTIPHGKGRGAGGQPGVGGEKLQEN